MGKWIYCTFKINIKVSFTKGLAIQQCTRGKLYIWNEFVTKKANMDMFKGCVSLPLPYAWRQSFLWLSQSPFQKHLDKIWGPSRTGVLVGGNHLSDFHSSSLLNIDGKHNQDKRWCCWLFFCCASYFVSHPMWLLKLIKVTIQEENSLHRQFWRIHIGKGKHP